MPNGRVAASLNAYIHGAWTTARLGSDLRDVSCAYRWLRARAGTHDVNFASGHGEQSLVVPKDRDMVMGI